MKNYELTDEDMALLRRLHDAGCAVCVFLPQEMGHSDQEEVASAMCEAGWNQIHFDDDYAEIE